MLDNNHTHNGVDAPRIDPINLKGFPIFNAEVVHNASEGTVVLENISGTIKLCAMIGGTWYKATLS